MVGCIINIEFPILYPYRNSIRHWINNVVLCKYFINGFYNPNVSRLDTIQLLAAITLIKFPTIRYHSYWEINHQRKQKHFEYVEEKKEQWYFEYEDRKKSITLWVWTKKKSVDEVETIIFFFLLMGASSQISLAFDGCKSCYHQT